MKELQRRIENEIKNSLLYRSSNFEILSSFLNSPLKGFKQSELFEKIGEYNSKMLVLNENILDENCKRKEPFSFFEKIMMNDDINQLKMVFVNDSFDKNMKLTGKEFGDRKMTLIELAAKYDARKCFDFLLSQNVLIERSKNGESYDEWGIMEYAAMNGNEVIIKKCLEMNLSPVNITFGAACLSHCNYLLMFLLQHNRDPTITFDFCFIQACRSNNLEAIFLMLEHGANILYKTSELF